MKLEVFVRRHEFCVTIGDIAAAKDRARRTNTYWPKRIALVCDHPKDGYCADEVKAAIKDGKVTI